MSKTTKERFKKLDKKYGNETLRKMASKVNYEAYYEEYVRLGRYMTVNKVMMSAFCAMLLVCMVAQFFVPAVMPLGLVILLLEFYETFDLRVNGLRQTQIMVIICTAIDRTTAADMYSSISKALEQGLDVLKKAEEKCGKGSGKSMEKCVRKDKNVKE